VRVRMGPSTLRYFTFVYHHRHISSLTKLEGMDWSPSFDKTGGHGIGLPSFDKMEGAENDYRTTAEMIARFANFLHVQDY
jgi:hypothetical protein